MKTGLAVMAALIGSTNASVKTDKKNAFSATDPKGKYNINGEAYFFKHPTTGKPYLSVNLKASDVELKDGLALCFDFANKADVDEETFLKGAAGKDDDKNYPVNYVVKKGETAAPPKGTSDTAGDKKKQFKNCDSTKVGKHKTINKHTNASPNQNFSVDDKSGSFQWITPICDGKAACEVGLKMKPGEEWFFAYAIGGKKIIFDSGLDGVKTLKVPDLNEIDTMKGDFVTFKGASHMTASVILASAALATMTLY